MARVSSIIAILGMIALSALAAPGATAPCTYSVTAAQNGSTILIGVNASNTKTCAAGSLGVSSLFPNDTVLSADLYQSNSNNVSTVTVTAERVSSTAFLDGGVCVGVGNGSTQHVCSISEKVSGSKYILKTTTTTSAGGSFVNGSSSIAPAGLATPASDLNVFQSCGNYTSKISDFTQTVIIGSSNDIQGGNYKGLQIQYAIVKTKHLPNYKVVDFSTLNVSTKTPFAQLAPVNVVATATTANTTASANGTSRVVSGSVTQTKPDGTTVTMTQAPQCYSLNITFETLLRNPDATCYLVGCDVILIMTDGTATYDIQTGGLVSTQFEMTKLAIGLIIGIVVGVLVLCSCLIGIIHLCRKRGNPEEHQRLVNN